MSQPHVGMCSVVSPHLVRLVRVHRSICVVVHQFVDAADGLKAQQGVFILTELLIDHTQIYNTGRHQHMIISSVHMLTLRQSSDQTEHPAPDDRLGKLDKHQLLP